MQIAIIAHDSKKELITQFCIAYCGILSKHTICATGTTGNMVAEATGLNIHRYLSGKQGGDQQIAARISCNEIDVLFFFRDPLNAKAHEPNEMTLLRLSDVHNIPVATNIATAEASLIRLCDVHNIPVATNIATAEALIHALGRGDLDWREIVNPQNN